MFFPDFNEDYKNNVIWILKWINSVCLVNTRQGLRAPKFSRPPVKTPGQKSTHGRPEALIFVFFEEFDKKNKGVNFFKKLKKSEFPLFFKNII